MGEELLVAGLSSELGPEIVGEVGEAASTDLLEDPDDCVLEEEPVLAERARLFAGMGEEDVDGVGTERGLYDLGLEGSEACLPEGVSRDLED